MLNTPDLYLGTFLVLAGFALSLVNLRRIVKNNDTSFSAVLLSENILLMCIGIAFVTRSVYEMNLVSVSMAEMEERSVEMVNTMNKVAACNFESVLMSYGPLIVSLVNSFISLIIDNYMHYRMLDNLKNKDEENDLQQISHRTERMISVKKIFQFWKKYFSFISIALQWIVPILMVLSMYPMGVKEMTLPMNKLRSLSESCLTMLDINNETCSTVTDYENYTMDIRNYIYPESYLEVFENEESNENNSHKINSVISNVYKIVANLKNNTNFMSLNVTSPLLYRKSKSGQNCIKMCYLENNKLLLYMFLLAIVSYFVPITISTVILTKIHVMDVKKPNAKTYVSRELIYNILFWTPVMFDSFLSLIFCSYSMNGTRTSLFNIVANIYQAVKNFMNTKYFKDNTVVPV